MNENDTNPIIASEPVDTRDPATIQPVVNLPAETPEVVEEEPTDADAPQGEVEETPEVETPTPPSIDAKRLEELQRQQFYKPQENTEVDILDEFGNIDPAKFAQFMTQNNQQVFTQALDASRAYGETERIEAQAWEAVHKDYPEIATGSALETALKGARLQDVIDGGDGDLTRLAKDLVAPIRDAKIQAVESANKQVEKAKVLDTAVPNNATSAPAPAKPLMAQLNEAMANGDRERAEAIRHAIRKERIFGTTK